MWFKFSRLSDQNKDLIKSPHIQCENKFQLCILFFHFQVSRASKQFLKLMMNKAVMRVQDVNPMLFNYVEELSEVKVSDEQNQVYNLLLNCTGNQYCLFNVSLNDILVLLICKFSHLIFTYDNIYYQVSSMIWKSMVVFYV